MNRRNIIYNILIFAIYLLLQVMLFDNMVLFGSVFCFMYIGFILLLPLEFSAVGLVVVGFVSGLAIDVFYNSLGVNTAASLFIAYLRPYWLSAITPRGGYDEVQIPGLKMLGFSWFITYALPLIFLHHISLFLIEAGDLINFWFILKKSIFSSLFTLLILVIGQYLFYNRKHY